MIRLAIAGAKRNSRHSGICGQAPSDYPKMAEFLVKQGIDSISLNPDTVIKTTLHIRGGTSIALIVNLDTDNLCYLFNKKSLKITEVSQRHLL